MVAGSWSHREFNSGNDIHGYEQTFYDLFVTSLICYFTCIYLKINLNNYLNSLN